MMKAKPVKSTAPKTDKGIEDVNPSVGDHRAKDYPAVKTSGVKIRGTGAARKGVMARGPMA
jgi:hypothetical protein